MVKSKSKSPYHPLLHYYFLFSDFTHGILHAETILLYAKRLALMIDLIKYVLLALLIVAIVLLFMAREILIALRHILSVTAASVFFMAVLLHVELMDTVRYLERYIDKLGLLKKVAQRG